MNPQVNCLYRSANYYHDQAPGFPDEQTEEQTVCMKKQNKTKHGFQLFPVKLLMIYSITSQARNSLSKQLF